MTKYLNDTGLEWVWEKFRRWAASMFAFPEHDHVNISGDARAMDRLKDVRTITLSGGMIGSAAFDGSEAVSIATQVKLDGDSTGVLPIEAGGFGHVMAQYAREKLGVYCGYYSAAVSLATGGYTSFTISFDQALDTIPIVLVTGESNTGGRMNGLVMNVASRSTTGFTVDLYNATAGATGPFTKGINWIAIEN